MNKLYLEKLANQIKTLRAQKDLLKKLKIIADNLGVKVKDLFDFE